MPAASWLIVAWLSVLGAVFGSFLNVVVWRVPRGESLVEPPSQCPMCRHPIRWYDNIPILGWLLLRGRCRDCQAPISARYPLVEAACFASFFILAILECGLHGVNLPYHRALNTGELVPATDQSGPALYGMFLFHQMLWCTLLAGGLIEYDGHRVGWRMYAPALAVAVLAGSTLPGLHPVPAWGGLGGWYAGMVDTAVGLVAGAATGWLLRAREGIKGRFWRGEDKAAKEGEADPSLIRRCCRTPAAVAHPKRPVHQSRVLSRGDPAAQGRGVWFGLMCVGGFLGWQAAIGLAGLTLLWQLGAAAVGRRNPAVGRVPASLALVVLTFAWLVMWAPLVQWIPWFG